MIDWVFSGIGIATIPIIYFILINRRKKNIIRDIENEIHQKDDCKYRLMYSIKEFNSYVPANIFFYNVVNKKKYAINELKSELKYTEIPPKLNVIFGDPGTGKSILMTYFCYHYCKYHSFSARKRFNRLCERGVIYIRFLHYSNLDQIINKISFDVTNSTNIDLLILDGLDEFRILNQKVAEDVLLEIFERLETDGILSRLKQVYITSRKEPFIDEIEDINSFIGRVLYQGNRPRIGQISLLTPEQIIKVYTKSGFKRNKNRLRKFVQNQHTIFEIPFFIQYADIIFDMLDDTLDGKNLIKEDAIFLIIENWIKNEWKKYWSKYSRSCKGFNETQLFKKYNKLIYNCLYEIGSYLILNNDYEWSLETMKSIAIKIKCSEMIDSVYYLLTRNLIHKNNNKFAFVHYSFYEFIIAKTLLENLEIPFEIRRNFLLGRNKTQIKLYYIYHINNIICCKNRDNYLVDFKNEQDILELKELSINQLFLKKELDLTCYALNNVSLVLHLFPNIEKLKFHQYELNLKQINELRYYKILNFSLPINKRVNSIKYIDKFGQLSKLSLIDNEMDDIYDSIEILQKLKLDILEIDVASEDVLLKLLDLKNINQLHVYIDFRSSDVQLFELINKLFNEGKPIFIINSQCSNSFGDFVYYNNKINNEQKEIILRNLYKLYYKYLIKDLDDKLAYIDIGNYLVNILSDNNKLIEAGELADYLIFKEDDYAIRGANIAKAETYTPPPNYSHIDLLVTRGEIYIKMCEYEKAFYYIERGYFLAREIYGDTFMLRGSFTRVTDRTDLDMQFLYGKAACLAGKQEIAIKNLSEVKDLNVFMIYRGFCSKIFLAKIYCDLQQWELANNILWLANSQFVHELENKEYYFKYKENILYYNPNHDSIMDICLILIDIIKNEQCSIYKNGIIIDISTMLYGKILIFEESKINEASKLLHRLIDKMIEKYGADNLEVIKEKEIIEKILNDISEGVRTYTYLGDSTL